MDILLIIAPELERRDIDLAYIGMEKEKTDLLWLV